METVKHTLGESPIFIHFSLYTSFNTEPQTTKSNQNWFLACKVNYTLILCNYLKSILTLHKQQCNLRVVKEGNTNLNMSYIVEPLSKEPCFMGTVQTHVYLL